MIKRELYRFFAAILFYSRIPIHRTHIITEDHFQKSGRYLPWVGFIISSLSGIILYIASYILPLPVAVLIALTINTLLTGALHEDGLADICDGFGGGYNKQSILNIMKDSHIGAYGTIGLILSYLIRFTALSSMSPNFSFVFFIAGNTLSRFMLVTIMYWYSYARTDGSGKANIVIGQYTIVDILVALIPVVPAFLFIGNLTSLFLIIPVWITKWLLAIYYNRKIEGYTGDCMGATQQITEIVFYIAALIWLKYTL